MDVHTAPTPTFRWHRPGLVVFATGVVVWVTAVVVTATTEDTILVPTVIIVGSFTVPLAVVVAALHREERRGGTGLSTGVMLEGFLLAGAMGVVLSALVETYLLPSEAGSFIAVGLIEETTKGIVIVLVAHRIRTRAPLDGMVLGAVVGAGFAAFESAGYAFSAYIEHGTSHPFISLLQTEITRAVLSPFGHILWTSVLGGAIFAAAAADGRFRITSRLAWTYAGVVALHALWDQSYGWAIIITRGLTGSGWHLGWPKGAAWLGEPTGHQLHVFNIVYEGLLMVNAAIGVFWAVYEWRHYRRQELEATGRAEPVIETGVSPAG